MKVTSPSTIQELKSQGVYVYDFSSISGSLRCPRYYLYRYEMGLSPITVEPSVSLMFGGAVHKALQHWYTNRNDDDALLVFAEAFKPYEEKPQLSAKTGKELDATYTVRFGCSLLDSYFTKYGHDEFTLLQNEEPVAEELVPGIYIAGRIDKIIRRKRQTFIDHKTSKYMDKFNLNPKPQFMGYKFLCEKLTGEHTSGELDMLGVSKTKDLTTLLRREPFDYSPYQMDCWKRSIIHHIAAINSWRENKFFPQYWRCQEFFRDCAFLPLCSLARQEEHDSLVANLYKVEWWDPFEID